MFSFIRALWARFFGGKASGPPDVSTPDVWLPGDQGVFRYFDGEKVVTADPMVLSRKVDDASAEIDSGIKLAQSAAIERPPGMTPPAKGGPLDPWRGWDEAVKKIREIFGAGTLKDLGDGKWSGLTDEKVFELFDAFLNYRDALKKTSSQSPAPAPASATSSPSSAASPPASSSGPSTSSTPAPGSTTKPGPSPTA